MLENLSKLQPQSIVKLSDCVCVYFEQGYRAELRVKFDIYSLIFQEPLELSLTIEDYITDVTAYKEVFKGDEILPMIELYNKWELFVDAQRKASEEEAKQDFIERITNSIK